MSKRERTELDKAHLRALAKLTPKQKRFLRELPKNNGQPWRTIVRLGYSKRTLHEWNREPRFLEAKALQAQVDERNAGITRESILLRTNEIVDRCMQAVAPVLDREGEHVITETPDGEALAYEFDARSALKGLEMLAKFRGMDVERVEVTGKDGGPIETKDLSEFEKARRIAFLLARGMQLKDSPPEDSGTAPQTTL